MFEREHYWVQPWFNHRAAACGYQQSRLKKVACFSDSTWQTAGELSCGSMFDRNWAQSTFGRFGSHSVLANPAQAWRKLHRVAGEEALWTNRNSSSTDWETALRKKPRRVQTTHKLVVLICLLEVISQQRVFAVTGPQRDVLMTQIIRHVGQVNDWQHSLVRSHIFPQRKLEFSQCRL